MSQVAKHMSALAIALMITVVSFSQTLVVPNQPGRVLAVELA